MYRGKTAERQYNICKDAGKKDLDRKGIMKGKILCENRSKAQRHPLQSRTPSPTGRPWNLCLFVFFMKGYLSILSNNVIVILIAYHGHQTSLFRVPLS